MLRESSRVLLPFNPPQPRPTKHDDSDLLRSCVQAGNAVPLFVKLGKLFDQADRAAVDRKVAQIFTENKINVTVHVRRTYVHYFTDFCSPSKICEAIKDARH